MVNVFNRAPRFRVLATKRSESPKDVTDYVLAVTTSKDLNSFVGKFTLTLRNRIQVANQNAKDNKLRGIKNIEEFFRPMTYIQIFATVKGDEEVSVMRGFIDSVGSTESVGENSALDQSVISGSDMGKIFVKQRLFFRPELSAVLATSAQRQSFLAGAAENAVAVRIGDFVSAAYSISLFSRNFTPNVFMHEILNIFVQPYIKKVLKEYQIPRLAEHLAGSFSVDTGSEIVLLKLFLANLTTQHGSILNVLDYAKNAPWCEMFIQELDDRSVFVFRATPWRVPDGEGAEKKIPLMTLREFISLTDTLTPGEGSRAIDIDQENSIANSGFTLNEDYNNSYFTESSEVLDITQDIKLTDIIRKQIFRDDADVFTYFSMYPYELMNWKIANLNGLYQDTLATSNPFLLRAHTNFYGFRPIEIKSTFSPFILDAKNNDRAGKSSTGKNQGSEKQLKTTEPLLRSYLNQFNTAVVDAYRYNPDYEKGTIQILGDPSIRIGQYITMEIKDQRSATFYVEGVSHNFVAFDKFTTILRLTRGTAAINNGNSIVDTSLNTLEKAAVEQDRNRQYISPEPNVEAVAKTSAEMNETYRSK